MNASSLPNAFRHLFIRTQREFVAAPQLFGASNPAQPARRAATSTNSLWRKTQPFAQKDLAAVVRLAEWIFQPIADHKQITLKVEMPATALLAECDEVRIQRVLENLLSNAIKYSPAGSTITLGACCANGTVRFWVDDEGPGVPLDEQNGLFENEEHFLSFLDAEDAGADRGLVLSRQIIATHHGQIEMRNRCEGGAHFEFRLPAAHTNRFSPMNQTVAAAA
jgi:signal transduction histidine kinase